MCAILLGLCLEQYIWIGPVVCYAGRRMVRQALPNLAQSQCQALKAAAWPPGRLHTRALLIRKRRPWLSMRMPL